MLMLLPLVLFWVMIYMASDDLGLKGILIFIGIWLGAAITLAALELNPHYFVAVQAVLDIILLMIYYGNAR